MPPRLVACVVAVAAVLTVGAQQSGLLGGMEQASVAARFHVRGAQPPADVAVVGIDAKTFGDLNRQWPFPRSLHGHVLRRLHAAGASQVVYDVQFTEPSSPAQDEALYRSLGANGGAILATSESDGAGRTRVLGGDANLRAVHSRAAASDLTDTGRTITRFPYETSRLPSMGVAAARRAGVTVPGPGAFGSGGALIDYRGPPGTIPTYSFSDVLAGRFPGSAFRGRVVVVGAVAPTLRDVHATPAGGGQMPGAEVQANAIWTALHGLPLRDAPAWTAYLLVALMALVAPLAVAALRGVAATAITVVAAVTLLVGAQLAFDAGTVVAVVAPGLALLIGAIGSITASRLQERRARLDTERENEVLEAKVRERTDQLWQTQLELVQRLGQAVDWRDGDTGEHVARIGLICERLALAAGMSPHEAELVRHAAVLHDVGKVGIADDILKKPSRLEADEWETMKLHASIGGSILADSGSELIQLACAIAMTHHENWDGSGYPAGLAGREIPRVGRICAVADVFDALASPRPYKRPWKLDEVVAEMARGRSTKFDPELIDLFMPLAPGLHAELFGAQPATTRTGVS